MYPPVFPTVNASSTVRTLLGPNPVRFYQFGQNDQQPVVYPYAVWQRIYGNPNNFLGDVPDSDNYTLQIDVYVAPTQQNGATKAREIAAALRDALEAPLTSYVTQWLGESRDPETKAYRFSFQNEWLVAR